MAIRTIRLGQADQGLVTCDLEWDDVTGRPTRVVSVNNGLSTNPDGSPAPSYLAVWSQTDPSARVAQRFGVGTTLVPIPNNIASRYNLRIVQTPKGGPRLDGYDSSFEYPYTPGP